VQTVYDSGDRTTTDTNPSIPSASDTRPFLLKRACPGASTPASPGCLLVHGFTGTPQEMRFLGHSLHAGGYTVSAVRLAGHCTSVDELERTTWHDWYASARAGVEELQRDTPRMVAVGQSMGALLALKLAVEYPHVIAGVVLLSPALVLSNPWVHRIGPALPLLLPLFWRSPRVGKGERDVADRQARAESPGYREVPLQALHQLLVLQKQVRSILPQVRQPALIVHSRQDHTCPLRNVTILQRGLGGPVRPVFLDNSFHVVSIDVDKQRVAAEVMAFVEAIASPDLPHTPLRSCD
jgi:carboxylesterase